MPVQWGKEQGLVPHLVVRSLVSTAFLPEHQFLTADFALSFLHEHLAD